MKYLLVLKGFLCLFFVGVFCQDKKLTTGLNTIEVTTGKTLITTEIQKKSTPIAKSTKVIEEKKVIKPPKLVCPDRAVPRPLFSLPCADTKDCAILGKGLLCCNNRCIKGVPPPKIEMKHEPTLFGLVDRKCPADPIPEIFEIKACDTDFDCAPRICCPERLKSGETVGYCRTAEPVWDKVPVPKQIMDSLRAMIGYMQCTPPPPPILDVFPKPCNSPIDCFPNLCCQEAGRKFCRPPKRSLLALVAGIGQRLVPSDAARALIERIS